MILESNLVDNFPTFPPSSIHLIFNTAGPREWKLWLEDVKRAFVQGLDLNTTGCVIAPK